MLSCYFGLWNVVICHRLPHEKRANPEEIARAIMAAPVQSGEAPRKAIEDLNTSFIQQMEELLGNA